MGIFQKICEKSLIKDYLISSKIIIVKKCEKLTQIIVLSRRRDKIEDRIFRLSKNKQIENTLILLYI